MMQSPIIFTLAVPFEYGIAAIPVDFLEPLGHGGSSPSLFGSMIHLPPPFLTPGKGFVKLKAHNSEDQ